MKKILLLLSVLVFIFSFIGCESNNAYNEKNNNYSQDDHVHSFLNATCTEAQKCSCGQTKGEPLGHNFSVATCNKPQKCTRCNITGGNPLGHNFSVATCNEPKKCTRCNITEGSKLGHQYSGGYCIRCNSKDPNYVEYGTIKGTITYKYNNYLGDRGDSGATVILFPSKSSVKNYDNARACLGITGSYESGIMVAECDGNGNYVFDNVPIGRYYVFIISNATNDGGAFNNKEARNSWIKGNFSDLLNDDNIKTLTTLIGYNKIYAENIDVLANRTHTVSKYFGTTYT